MKVYVCLLDYSINIIAFTRVRLRPGPACDFPVGTFHKSLPATVQMDIRLLDPRHPASALIRTQTQSIPSKCRYDDVIIIFVS